MQIVKEKEEQVEKDVKEKDKVERYDPASDVMAKMFALFTHSSFAYKDPEISIAARILTSIRREAVDDPERCPAMAVTLKRGSHILLYNPSWMETVTFEEIKETLIHEAYHVMLLDIPRFLRRLALFPTHQRGAAHRILNVAMDAANNWLIQHRIPSLKYGVTGHWVLPAPLGLPEDMSTEMYFEILLRRVKEDKDENGKGAGQGGTGSPDKSLEEALDEFLDSKGLNSAEKEELKKAIQELIEKNAHDWLSGEEDSSEEVDGQLDGKTLSPLEMSEEEMEALASILETEAKQITKKSLQAHQRRYGRLPGPFQEILNSLLDDVRVPWTTVLRSLVAARISSEKFRTPVKFQKNQFIFVEENDEGEFVFLDSPFPVFPGTEEDRTFVIMFAIDTSGSMSSKDIIEGLSELQGLVRVDPNTHVIVVQADTKITSVEILEPDNPAEGYLRNTAIAGRGGTDFNQPFRLAEVILQKEDTGDLNISDTLREKVREVCSEYDSIDLMVYHTDGGAPAPSFKHDPPFPVIWILPEHNGAIPGFGGKIPGTVVKR